MTSPHSGAPCPRRAPRRGRVTNTPQVVDAKFKTFGCGSAIASSSLATEWLKGRKIDDAGTIKNSDIAEELALPPVKIHCSVLAEDAIRQAIADFQSKQAQPAEAPASEEAPAS